MSTLLQDLDDYVGRVVIANLMRQLIHQGVNASTFWPPETADQISLGFPTQQQSSSAWLEALQRYFADLDMIITFGAQYELLTTHLKPS
jgi:gluconate kinase